jgi:hypothetical protein
VGLGFLFFLWSLYLLFKAQNVTATSGQSSKISGRLRPCFRCGQRKVARPAASNTGRNLANVRRTLDSAMLKK